MNGNHAMMYRFLPAIFMRAPYYSFSGYDLSRLQEVLQEQAFRNAVWLASPGFYRLLEKNGFDFESLKDKEKHTLYKYYNRMCFRPTPFGSFASFTLLEWGNGGQVKLSANNGSIIHLLPDQQLLHGLNQHTLHLPSGPDIMVNPSLYRFENHFRYTKSTVNENGKYIFSLESIAAVKFNADLFSFLGTKRLAATELISWIIQHGDCTEEEAWDYLQFLLDAQAFLSDAQGDVICSTSACEKPELNGWSEFWAKHRSLPSAQDTRLNEIARELQQVFTGRVSGKVHQPFYAALERPALSGGPDNGDQTELLEAVRVLQALAVDEQPGDLLRFIRDFRNRFDREKVPLLTALDPDAGLPYGDLEASGHQPDVLENLLFPQLSAENKQLGWNAVQQLLFRLWIGDTLRDPWSPLQISVEDIRGLEMKQVKKLPPPQTQAFMYRDTGEHLIIENSGGATGVSLIGRFSCFSDQVHEFCLELADREIKANPGVVFADIGQLSDTHVDNINRRLQIYPYEIPVNVYSATQQENLILPDDLVIYLQGDELILESTRLGRRVIPRLASAYNFRNNHLPVFRLLCDLQFQGIRAGLYFDLESLFPGLYFYPRVSYGRVVLSLAKWNFKEEQLREFTGKEPAALLEALQAFRIAHHIPRHVTMGAHDQQLVFDLAHASDALFFLQCLKGLKNATITEYLVPGRSVLAGKKPVAAQMIAFLYHGDNIYKAASQIKTAVTNYRNRNFRIGSNWLYLKIYCIPRAADTILAKVIGPFVAANRRIIKSWFFIRYLETGYHLRLRIQAEDSDLGVLLVALRNKIESAGHEQLIRDYQGDTYRREIERYGVRLMPHAEDLFSAGSDLVTLVIRERQAGKATWTEFELAMLSAKLMIFSFIPDVDKLETYLKDVTDSFTAEFRADKQLKMGLDGKYREMKAMIAGLLENDRPKLFKPLLKEMANLNRLTANDLPEKRSALLADLVHMQLNRTFSVQQRQQEMLVYYCLQKYTASGIARVKQ